MLAVATVSLAASAMAATAAGTVTLNPVSGQAVKSSNLRGAADASFQVGVPAVPSLCSGNTTTNPTYAAALYIAGTGVDLTTVDFFSLAPAGSGTTFLSSLYNVTGTAQDFLTPGAGPGFQVSGGTSSLWKVADNANLSNGTYRVGLACYNNGTGRLDAPAASAAANYWESTITICDQVTTSPGSGSFKWTLGTITCTPSVPESPLVVALPLSAVAIGVGVYMVRRRRVLPA
jgi:hypothetical protein